MTAIQNNFDFYQIPQTGVVEPDLSSARAGVNTPIRRSSDMKISNFGALNVGNRLGSDYTRTDSAAFAAKGNSEDWNVLTADTGIGSNVASRSSSVNHNPLLWGNSIKYTRDEQFIRMTMSNNEGTQVDGPKFDVMDSRERTAEGIAALGLSYNNWPYEGWRSFGGKNDFGSAPPVEPVVPT